MTYGTNDPAKIAALKFADLTDEQRLDTIERARASAIADGGGIAILPEITVISLLEQANAARIAAAKAKGEAQFSGQDLNRVRMARLGWGKDGVDTPLKHRGEFLREFGEVEFKKEDAKWLKKNPTDKDIAPRRNPYKGVKGLKRALRGTEENTEFNQIFNADRIRTPKPLKLSKEAQRDNPFSAAAWSVTRQGEIYKTLGADVANRMAAAAGVRVGSTKPVM